MVKNSRLPVFALILLLASLLMGVSNARAQDNTPTATLTGPASVSNLDEFCFRLNEGNVEIDTIDRMTSVCRKMTGKRPTYRELVA